MYIIQLFKKMKHWNLNIINYLVIAADSTIEKDLELSPYPPSYLKDSRKVLALVYIY